MVNFKNCSLQDGRTFLSVSPLTPHNALNLNLELMPIKKKKKLDRVFLLFLIKIIFAKALELYHVKKGKY